MHSMKKLPLGIQTFSEVIEGDRVYADKTGLLLRLIESGDKAVFLSRPRRFGNRSSSRRSRRYSRATEGSSRGWRSPRRDTASSRAP
jgi:hypothetical protein